MNNRLGLMAQQVPEFILPSLLGGLVAQVRAPKRCSETWRAFSIRVSQHLLCCLLNGYIAMQICKEMGLSPDMAGAVCAVSGYLGTHALDFLVDVVKSRTSGD